MTRANCGGYYSPRTCHPCSRNAGTPLYTVHRHKSLHVILIADRLSRGTGPRRAVNYQSICVLSDRMHPRQSALSSLGCLHGYRPIPPTQNDVVTLADVSISSRQRAGQRHVSTPVEYSVTHVIELQDR